MVTVFVENNNIELAIRHLKRLLRKSDLLWELKRREFFLTPREMKRKKRARVQAFRKRKGKE